MASSPVEDTAGRWKWCPNATYNLLYTHTHTKSNSLVVHGIMQLWIHEISHREMKWTQINYWNLTEFMKQFVLTKSKEAHFPYSVCRLLQILAFPFMYFSIFPKFPPYYWCLWICLMFYNSVLMSHSSSHSVLFFIPPLLSSVLGNKAGWFMCFQSSGEKGKGKSICRYLTLDKNWWGS